ncbi:hypothetical protein P7K49_024737, partial [Saguinus oedipus]
GPWSQAWGPSPPAPGAPGRGDGGRGAKCGSDGPADPVLLPLQVVHTHKPHFMALHCQEFGGKNYEASMSHVDKFVK